MKTLNIPTRGKRKAERRLTELPKPMINPMNAQRVKWAEAAVAQHEKRSVMGTDGGPLAVAGLLCNLRHYADASGLCYGDLDKMAHQLYLKELGAPAKGRSR